jgi:hypothetical protein
MATDLAQRLEAQLGRPLATDEVAFLYGSSSYGAGRDYDVVILSDHVPAKYIHSQDAIPLNLHIVGQRTVERDIHDDYFGWIFLTKFLSDIQLIHGTPEVIIELRCAAHLRLLGQSLSAIGANEFSERSYADLLQSVLEAWNPQCSTLFRKSLLRADSLQRFAQGILVPRCLARGIFVQTGPGVLVLDKTYWSYRNADLRVVLVLYWAHYLQYKNDPSQYLCSNIRERLAAKGIVLS